jgi:ABC-type proline/glycine betaine transport system substrate-binding protein
MTVPPSRGIIDNIVSHKTVATTNANAIRPLLKAIGTCETNLVVLDDGIVAAQVALGNMQTRPTAWVPRMNIFGHHIR